MDSQTLCVLHHRTKCAALKGELCLLIHFRELFSNIMRKHCLLSCHKMLTFNISAKCSVSTLLFYFPTTAAHKKMTDNFFQLNLDIHSACVAVRRGSSMMYQCHFLPCLGMKGTFVCQWRCGGLVPCETRGHILTYLPFVHKLTEMMSLTSIIYMSTAACVWHPKVTSHTMPFP